MIFSLNKRRGVKTTNVINSELMKFVIIGKSKL